ncbi:ABC transporter substrate-binding protein [Kitasatospora sp. NPDC051914]|uniref:ABC transporter substrate-binding protein n=1 Tax=Kitasatospora sp. NPDC051914 TaxID=3154945 RepID=UPI0034450959
MSDSGSARAVIAPAGGPSAASRTADRRSHRRRMLRSAAALGCAGLALTACSSGGTPVTPAASGIQETITLKVGTFGSFGYREAGLFAEYMDRHPEIVITEEATQDGKEYWNDLTSRLSGQNPKPVADIQAVEVGYIAEATGALADKFTDLRSATGVQASAWLPWKSAQATTPDGALLGLGTDTGPMAVCYRKDLFKKAGLPSDRDAVGRLWAGDWSKFIDVGRRYKAHAPAKTTFTDSAGGLFNAVLSSESEQLSDARGHLVYQDSAGVQKAWDLSVSAARAGLTGGLQQFTAQWNDALYLSGFATIVCPSWMTGVISKYAGDRGEGLWDIAPAPAAGNWGGAFLAVPKASRHQKEAAALAAWLTAPEQQAKVFAKTGNLPSAGAALQLPAVQDATNPYFNNAPTGRIYAAAARTIRPAPIGPLDGTAKAVITDTALLDVERNGTDPRKAWNSAVKLITEKAGG